jgi:hypothetical protein
MLFKKQFALYILVVLVLSLVAACAPQEPGVPVTGETPGLPPEAVLDAQQWLADQLNTAVEQVEVAEVEQMEWTDACLGLGQPNEACAQVITPGWRAVFEVNGELYEVRTDETGTVIRMSTP